MRPQSVSPPNLAEHHASQFGIEEMPPNAASGSIPVSAVEGYDMVVKSGPGNRPRQGRNGDHVPSQTWSRQGERKEKKNL